MKKETGNKNDIILRIKKRRLNFLERVMRKEVLRNLTQRLEGQKKAACVNGWQYSDRDS